MGTSALLRGIKTPTCRKLIPWRPAGPDAFGVSLIAQESSMRIRSISDIDHYHAHVYFDAENSDKGWALREVVGQTFEDVVVGRFHEREVGPHSAWMFQVAFETDRFATFVPWLSLNRDGLSVLVHPGTGDGLTDHIEHAMWLGDRLPIKTSHWDNR
jgi:aromatic ring-cleaving dioxygenase